MAVRLPNGRLCGGGNSVGCHCTTGDSVSSGVQTQGRYVTVVPPECNMLGDGYDRIVA